MVVQDFPPPLIWKSPISTERPHPLVSEGHFLANPPCNALKYLIWNGSKWVNLGKKNGSISIQKWVIFCQKWPNLGSHWKRSSAEGGLSLKTVPHWKQLPKTDCCQRRPAAKDNPPLKNSLLPKAVRPRRRYQAKTLPHQRRSPVRDVSHPKTLPHHIQSPAEEVTPQKTMH